jgi:hypothetical protein
LEGNISQDLFNDAYIYINEILEGTEKDDDTVKRAKSILAREKKLKSNKGVTELSNTKQDQVSLNEDKNEAEQVTKTLEYVTLEVPEGGIVVTASSTEDEDEEHINGSKKEKRNLTKNKKKSKKNKQQSTV